MTQVLPRIVERYPQLREQVLRERFRDPDFNELNCDYDGIIKELELENQRIKNGQGSSEHQRELLQLILELENELLARLVATHN